MKSRVVLAVIVLALLGAGCSGRAPVKIGLVGPLTGPSSAVGAGVRNGFLMRFEERTGRGPRPVHAEILVRDDRNNSRACLAAVRELEADGCRIIVLGTTSEAAVDAIAYANGRSLFIITPTVSDDSYSGHDDMFFRVNSPSSEYGAYLAANISARFGNARVVLIGDDNNARYTHLVFDSFARELERRKGKVSAEFTFDSTAGLPYADILDVLHKAAPDAVVIVTASAEAALICKQLERDGLRIPVYFPPWPLTLDLIQNGGRAVDGATAASIVDLEYTHPAGRRFLKQYRETYGTSPSFTAMFGCETASILSDVLLRAGSGSPRVLKRALLEIGTFKGLQGPITFDANGDAKRQMFLYRIEDGKFKRIE